MKAQGKRSLKPFSSERLASHFSPSRSCLGSLISSAMVKYTAGQSLPQREDLSQKAFLPRICSYLSTKDELSKRPTCIVEIG